MTVSPCHSTPAVWRVLKTDRMLGPADRMNVLVPTFGEGEAGYEGGGVAEDCVDGKHGLESGNSSTGAFSAFFTLFALGLGKCIVVLQRLSAIVSYLIFKWYYCLIFPTPISCRRWNWCQLPQ